MLELEVELVAVAIEEVLQALEQVGREEGPVAGGLAVGSDGVEPLADQGPVTPWRAEQAPPIDLSCRHSSYVDAGEHFAGAVASCRSLSGVDRHYSSESTT